MGKEITEYEVRHMLFLPKNAFSGHEYIPHEMPPANHQGLFGDDDEEEEGAGAAVEEAAPAQEA